ncbi:MAG: CDP-alcohol phosphatidyltransferase family protein [Paracoccaceae bacterium]
MIDSYLLPVQKAVLQGPARLLARRGVTADQMTLAGFALGVLAFLALGLGLFLTGLGLILLNRLADGLDGAIARQEGPTDRGAFLDIAADFLFYALVPLGFAIADPVQNALPAAFLITSFVGTGSSFLAFSAIAARRNLTSADYPAKGIYYLGGLTEGAETIGLFIAICLWPALFAPLASGFAILCLLTTAIRWRQAWLSFHTATPQETTE